MKFFQFVFLFLGILFSSCAYQSSKQSREEGYEYYFHRNGSQVQELKLKFNPSLTEVLEAFYLPVGEKNYIPLEILSKNDSADFYWVNYTELNQVLKLYTDFGSGASLYFDNQNFITFNKEYFCNSDGYEWVLITSGLPSFMPFFLTNNQQTFFHQFIPSNKDNHKILTHPEYPNSIVFEGSFTNGKNAKITVFQDDKTSKYSFLLEMDSKKWFFHSNISI